MKIRRGIDPITGLLVGRLMRLSFIEGDGQGGGTGGTGETPTNATTEGQTDAGADTGDNPDKATPDDAKADDISALPDWAQKHILDLRKESGDRRMENKTAIAEAKKAAYVELGKTLGVVEPDQEVDTDKVQATLAESQRELAIYRSAGADVNVQALLDSRSFLTSIKDIDPTDTAAITAAIKSAVDNNASFKVARAAPKSGGDLGGGSGESNKGKATTLAGALDAHYGR